MKMLELSELEYDPECIQRHIDKLEAKDAYTKGHSHYVFVVTQAIVAKLPIRQRQQINEKMLYAAALLHDIGKTTIPDSILNKEGSLNNEEWDIVGFRGKASRWNPRLLLWRIPFRRCVPIGLTARQKIFWTQNKL